MVSRSTCSIARVVRVAPVVCLLGTAACSGGWFATPTPTPTTRPTLTPTRVPTQPPPATDTPTPAGTLAPTPDAAATATVSARRAGCERALAVLAGRDNDPKALDNPEVARLAVAAPDLVVCGAVATDAVARCTRLMPEDSGPGGACRALVSIFHELKAYPKSHSFLITEDDGKELGLIKVPPSEAWDAVRAAVRSGDPNACAPAGDLAGICRAFIDLDPARCRVEGQLKDARVEAPKVAGKPKLGKLLEDFCKENIKTRGFLAKGLESVAESGPARERVLAQAALGRPDACAQYAEGAMPICMGAGSAAAAGTPAAPGRPATGAATVEPAATSSGAPAPPGR